MGRCSTVAVDLMKTLCNANVIKPRLWYLINKTRRNLVEEVRSRQKKKKIKIQELSFPSPETLYQHQNSASRPSHSQYLQQEAEGDTCLAHCSRLLGLPIQTWCRAGRALVRWLCG